jgi:trigger factor
MAKLKDTILEKGGKKEEVISHDQFMEELKK